MITRRWFSWIASISGVATAQSVILGINAVSGFLFVRLMEKGEYAAFTIACAMQAVINVLADAGITSGLLSHGGRVWHNREQLGDLVAAGGALRQQLAWWAALVSAPLWFMLLSNNGVALPVSVALVALSVISVSLSGASSVLATAPKLHAQIRDLQVSDLGGATTKFVGVIAAGLWSLSALIAMTCSLLGQIVQLRMLRRRASLWLSPTGKDQKFYTAALGQIVRENFLFALFLAVQGQLGLLIIGAIGTFEEVADIGALSRLYIISVLATTILNQVVSPAFARQVDTSRLVVKLRFTLVCATLFAFLSTAAGLLVPDVIIWVLGPSYRHLVAEVWLVMLGIGINAILATIWAAINARGWLTATWTIPVVTILLQLVLAAMMDLSSVRGVLAFGLFSQVPNFVAGVAMVAMGLERELKTEGQRHLR